MPLSVLFENAARTVVVVDLPRSIEEAQEDEDDDQDEDDGGNDDDDDDDDDMNRARPARRLLSSPPPTHPFAVPPGSNTPDDPAAQLADLATGAGVEAALAELRDSGFRGPWCLPRRIGGKDSHPQDTHAPYIPPGARYLADSIADGRAAFLADAPSFDLVVLDPPWPNRSARRRRQSRRGTTAYHTATDMEAVRTLLEAVPVGAKLRRDSGGSSSLVAVWITNSQACVALLTDPRRGVFRAWGVELVATWTWLKVTTAGAPVVALDAPWRRPWERLLLARPVGCVPAPAQCSLPPARVLVGVPDIHSRKPNLRPLLAPFVGRRPLVGLEVFARNLTAGWWAWGDEALLFQQREWWAEAGKE